MATHKSALKRIRQNEKKRVHNKYYAKTTRNAIKSLRELKEKEKARELFPKVVSMIDKLSKRNIIHKSNAARLKSNLARHVNSLESKN